jgi:hypothetical protein
MRNIRVKGAVFGLAFILSLMWIGCEEEKKEVCCTCTCYMANGSLPERTVSVERTKLSCNDACRIRCGDGLGMQYKNPETVECEDTSTD